MKAQKMKAIISTRYGGPEILQLQEVDKPIPKENEVLVKIKSSSDENWISTDWTSVYGFKQTKKSNIWHWLFRYN